MQPAKFRQQSSTDTAQQSKELQHCTAIQARQDDDEDEEEDEDADINEDDEELDSLDEESPASPARGLPDVSGDDLDTLIDEMEDELPGMEGSSVPQQSPEDTPEMPQREFPEPPDRSMTLNELMSKAQLPGVEGSGGDTLVCDLAMTPGHVLGGSLFFSLKGSEYGNGLGVYTAAYYDASVVLAGHDFAYDDEERQEVYTKIDIMEGEMKSVIEEDHIVDDEPEDDSLDGDWEADDEDLNEDKEFGEDDDRDIIDLANEAAEENLEPELTTDYLDNPEYTVDPPGLHQKAQAAEAARAEQGDAEEAGPLATSTEDEEGREDPRDAFLDDEGDAAESGDAVEAEDEAAPIEDGSNYFWAIGDFGAHAALAPAIHTEGASPGVPQIRFPDASEIDNERVFDANDLMKTIQNPNLPLMINTEDPNDGEMMFGDGLLTASPAGAYVDPNSPEMLEMNDEPEEIQEQGESEQATASKAVEGEEPENEEAQGSAFPDLKEDQEIAVRSSEDVDPDEDITDVVIEAAAEAEAEAEAIAEAEPDEEADFDPEAVINEGFAEAQAEYNVDGIEDSEVDEETAMMLDDDNGCIRLREPSMMTQSKAMTTIGVAGAAGKTTLTWLIRGMFEEHQQLTGVMGSLDYSLELTKLDQMGDIWEAEVKAPGEEDREHSQPLHLIPWVGKWPSYLECEVDAMAKGSCDGLDLDVAIYNIFYEDKAQELGLSDMEYRHRMGTIFRSLSEPSRQRAIINTDRLNKFVLACPYADEFRRYARYASRVPIVTFAMNDKEADIHVQDVKFGLYETEMRLITPVGIAEIITGLLGRHNVQNILAAVACGLALNLGLPEIITGIEATGFNPGRSALVDEMQEYSVVVDGARTPMALSRLLDNMRECGPKRLWLVFGCQGEIDEAARPLMGEIAHYKADIVILTSDNPRRELPQDIINGIISGFPEDMRELNANCDIDGGFLQDQGWVDETEREFVWYWGERWRRYVCEDRFTAIRWAISTAQEKDMVIIAGKGSDDFQEIASQLPDGNWAMLRGWFNDHSEARAAILATSKLQVFTPEHDRSDLPWVDVGDRESRFWDRLARMRETMGRAPTTAAGMGRSIV
ncbi:hypothetical protein WJX74_005823 [Apatococcus lobatus]|uniref:Uncharacterized protein n=1 Tax=Apatococcus lobatus TaxID=904363 RepID=A0AAW1QY98_9CHLO